LGPEIKQLLVFYGTDFYILLMAINLKRVISKVMEYQKAITILKGLLNRHPLNAEEKEAVMTAIGVLSWGSLSKSKIKAQKAKRDKSTEW
jgi:hypothetical protein